MFQGIRRATSGAIQWCPVWVLADMDRAPDHRERSLSSIIVSFSEQSRHSTYGFDGATEEKHLKLPCDITGPVRSLVVEYKPWQSRLLDFAEARTCNMVFIVWSSQVPALGAAPHSRGRCRIQGPACHSGRHRGTTCWGSCGTHHRGNRRLVARSYLRTSVQTLSR